MREVINYENFLAVSALIVAVVVVQAVRFLRGRDVSQFRDDIWEDPLWGRDPSKITFNQMQQTVDYIALEAPLGGETQKIHRKGKRLGSGAANKPVDETADTQKIFRAPNFAGRPHEVLGIPQNATKEQVLAAYKHWIKRYHPDRVQHLGPGYVKQANQRAEQLNDARVILLKRFA